MMAESEEAPTAGLGNPLAVFYGHVDSVVYTIEKSPSGWFRTRAVWKLGIKDPSQFFTIIVPSGNEPVFRYASIFFPSMYT